MSDVVTSARTAAERLLAGVLPVRWSHVRAVGAKAAVVSAVVAHPDRAVLIAAAWLHDIGYAPDLVDTGFHPLDGARWLRAAGWEARMAGLVANHSGALAEAAERGLDDVLRAEFPAERSAVADALVYCDLTTGPDGGHLDVVARLDEIRSRYGPESVVGRFVARAERDLVATVRRVERSLSIDGPDVRR